MSMKSKIKTSRFYLTAEYGLDQLTLDYYKKKGMTDLPNANPDHPLAGRTPPYQAMRQEMLNLGMVNGFRIDRNITDEKISDCGPDNNFILADLFRARSDWREIPAYVGKFKKCSDFLRWYIGWFAEEIKKHPTTVWGVIHGEIDTGHPWPSFFRNKKEAFRHWRNNCLRGRNPDDLSYKPHHIGGWILNFLRKKGLRPAHAPITLNCAMVFSVHYFFEWGFQMIWKEVLAQEHCQLDIAFLRGAARQHGGLWGTDTQPHHPHLNQVAWFDKQGRQRNGFTPSLTLRNWLTTSLSGAYFVHMQCSDQTHFIFQPDGTFRLSPFGRNAKRLADFCLREQPERGETIAPVAMLLNYYHGYSPWNSVCSSDTRASVWGGMLPFTNDDANITNFLNLFWPGHNQAIGTWDNVFNPHAPWRTQGEYVAMVKSGKDMRPYEKHCLINGPFGDCLDVVLDNVSEKCLRQYRLVILAGFQELDGEQQSRLLAFCRGGGILIAAMNQLPPEMLGKIGVRAGSGGWSYDGAQSGWDYDVTTCSADRIKFDGRRYGFAKARAKRGKVLGYNHDKYPLIWEVPCGRGRIILSAIPYGQDTSGLGLMPLCRHIYAKYITRVLPVQAGPEPLQTIVNRGDGFVLIGAINNSAKTWQGKLVLRGREVAGRPARITDIWNKKAGYLTSNGRDYVVEAAIKPFDCAVLKISG